MCGIGGGHRYPPTVAAIQRAVAEHYGVTVEEMKSPDVHRRITLPRHVGMELASRLTNHSAARIAVLFDKHPNTGLETLKQMRKRRREPELRQALRQITLELCR